jgi:hypothetical protein
MSHKDHEEYCPEAVEQVKKAVWARRNEALVAAIHGDRAAVDTFAACDLWLQFNDSAAKTEEKKEAPYALSKAIAKRRAQQNP